MYFLGLEVIENKMLVVQGETVPKRRNKNKRIQKKWNKKYGYYSKSIPDSRIFIVCNKIFVHPVIFKKIKKLIETK